MITVFVSGAGGGVGQGIIKSLKLISAIDISIISADASHLAPGLYTTNKSYLVPKASEADYIPELIEIFKKERVDFYFPGTDVELVKCAEYADFINRETGTTVVVSPLTAINIADDKYLTYEFIKSHNLPAPESYLPEALPVDLRFPVVVKPRIGCRSIGVGVVHNENELRRRIDAEPGLMVQELVGSDDEEYTCTVVAVNGVVSEALLLQRTLRSGDTFRARPVRSVSIEGYVTELAKRLEVNGSCNFQLRLSGNVPKVFEINCRFSGTTPFCSQLGFNPVEYYLSMVLGFSYTANIDYEKMVLRHWTESVVPVGDMDQLRKDGYLEPVAPSVSVL